MKVNNRLMYYYHQPMGKSLIIEPGREFTIDSSFNSNMYNMVMEHSMIVHNCDADVRLLSLVSGLLKDEKYKELDQEKILSLLRMTGFVLYREEMVIREIALEQYRIKNCPEKPSRLHSIWLSNKAGLPFWGNIFQTRDLFSLEVSGDLFKSSDEFLPGNGLSISDSLKDAERYWFPDFSAKHNPKRVEYLFQGRARVLTKIDRENK